MVMTIQQARVVGPALCAALLLVSSLAGTQAVVDDFNRPAGPLGGFWRVDRGQWAGTGAAARVGIASTRQFATLKRFAYRDCVVECRVFHHPIAAGPTQLAGVVVRANDPGQGRDLVVLEVFASTPSTLTGFDTFQIAEFAAKPNLPGGGVGWRVSRPFSSARIRLTALDRRMTAQIDVDNDGRWDRRFETFVAHVTPRIGPVGIVGAGGTGIDDFKVFDGVVIESLTSPYPRPGATVTLDLRGFPGASYQAAASLGTGGIPLQHGRVPLDLDPLFIGSVTGALGAYFKDFAGRLSVNGSATIRVAIPKASGLIGLTLHVAFIAHSGGQILTFSNDHAIRIDS
jgi:hypothetical protein